MRGGTAAALAGLALLLAAPAGSAHGPPAPVDQVGQGGRLLVDNTDDCGHDAATATADCHGTHDLVALDVYEAYDAALGEIVVFRLYMGPGDAFQGLRDVLTFTSAKGPKAVEISTSNDEDFSGTGFDRISKAGQVGDPLGRIFVDITLKREGLGAVGEKLSGYKVQAFVGSSKGDYLPGGYYNAAGVDNPNGGTPSEAYTKTGGYTLRGPSYYLEVTPPANVQVAPGATVVPNLRVRNSFSQTDQNVRVEVSAPAGVTAQVVDPDSQQAGATADADLPRTAALNFGLKITGQQASATGDVIVTVTSTHGGRNVVPVPFAVVAGGSATTGGPSSDSSGGGNGIPGPALPMTLALLGALAVLRRR